MPNFVKISCQMKELSIQAFYTDCSVYMAAICNSGPISAVPTNEHFLGEERTGAQFQFDSLKTERLVRIYIDRWTDRWTW